VEPGTYVVGRKNEFDPGRGDRMVFTYEGADAIWRTGPKPQGSLPRSASPKVIRITRQP